MEQNERDDLDQWVQKSTAVLAPPAGWEPNQEAARIRLETRTYRYATRRIRKTSWMMPLFRLTAVTILSVGAFAMIVTLALPKTGTPVSTPWTVDSEFIRYEADGSSSIEMYTTSYSVNDSEILLSWTLPGSPVRAALGRVLENVAPLFESAERRKRDETLKQNHLRHEFITRCVIGCIGVTYTVFSKVESQWTGCVPGTVVGHERILDYPTDAVRQSWMGENGRVTLWTAADLECFALRVTSEEKRPDGTFRLVSEKRALRVNLKR